VSCPDGPEYHERLKAAFPNLSSKIMDYLKAELIKTEGEKQVKETRQKWLMNRPYLTIKKLLAGMPDLRSRDPWNYKKEEFAKMLDDQGIVVTLEEAGRLLNVLMNEYE
jgi:hypothetical protein